MYACVVKRRSKLVSTAHPSAFHVHSATTGGGDGYSSDSDGGSDYRCVICTSTVETNGSQYMITPCNHVFHTECLVRWMDVKFECPLCRARLPLR